MKVVNTYYPHLLLILVLILPQGLTAQTSGQSSFMENLKSTINEYDSKFWTSYNTCDIESMKKYFSPDLEFYHDKEGLTSSRASMIDHIKNGLCKDVNKKLRRKALTETVNIYSIDGFGAIIEGEHLFYYTEGDKEEILVEKARFNHIWQRRESDWVMTRVISFDHQPISDNYLIKSVDLDQSILKKYVGMYSAPNSGLVELRLIDSGLEIVTQNMSLPIKPESKTTFYSEQAPLKFKFSFDASGLVNRFTVLENGKVLEEATRKE